MIVKKIGENEAFAMNIRQNSIFYTEMWRKTNVFKKKTNIFYKLTRISQFFAEIVKV